MAVTHAQTLGTAVDDPAYDISKDEYVAAHTVGDGSFVAAKLSATATDKLFGRATAGAGNGEEIACTAFARTVLDDADAATARATLGISGGTTKISGNTGAFVADTTWETLTSNSADVTSTTQTVVMTLTGVGSGTYRFKGLLIYQTAATATGIGITLNHTGTLTRFVSNWIQVTTGGAAATGIGDQVTATASGQLVEGKAERVKDTRSSFTVGVDTANADELVQMEGVFIVTASGDVQVKIATEIAASAVRLMAGSTIELHKVV